MARALALATVLSTLAACGGDDAATTGDAGPDAPGDGAVSSCDPPGRFGVPQVTFELPPTGAGLVYPDVQAAFPEVDWGALDRLYLPAGTYTQLMLGNLPVRTAARPLVITNKGGQVQIGPHPTGNYIWSMGGGAHWILTGRADAVSQTGDAAYPGHACGGYADSAGRYGIVSDDAFALDAPYLHMGLAVGGGATDFEIEYVEVTRSGFAGIRLLNPPADGTDKPMANVKVHDTYVHDTDGEGFYFGWTGAPPSNKFPGLQVYNNRILRTGNDALQLQDIGDGSRIHHNTLVSGGLHWLDNGLGRYQDNLVQLSLREGAIEIDHNVMIDGAGALISFFSGPQDGDGDRHVTIHDNYLAESLSLGVYLGGTSAPPSSFTWERNVFRALEFGYTPVDPAATDPDVVFGRGGSFTGAITLADNAWAGTTRLVPGIDGGAGAAGPFTLTGNRAEDPGAIALRDGPWSSPGHHLTWWVPTATVPDPDAPVTFRAGDVVAHGPEPRLFRATASSTDAAPPGATWTELPRTDDVRVAPGSPFAELGVR